MAARKKNRTKKEVEFDKGELTILNPELEEKVRKWWEESKRDTYAWAKIVLKPRTTTRRDQAEQLKRASLDSNPSSFSGQQVKFRNGRLIFVDKDLEQQIENWWKETERSNNDWAKVTIRVKHDEGHGGSAFDEVSHKAGHMDSNCIG